MGKKLNVDLLDGYSSEQFNLAFVTKQGSVTTDDVYLKGKVEVGQILEVRGATKLLDELLGKIGFVVDKEEEPPQALLFLFGRYRVRQVLKLCVKIVQIVVAARQK